MIQRATVVCMSLAVIFAFIGQSSAQGEVTRLLQTLFSPACNHLMHLMDKVYCTGYANWRCDILLTLLRKVIYVALCPESNRVRLFHRERMQMQTSEVADVYKTYTNYAFDPVAPIIA